MAVLSTSSFEALLASEELEERVEFIQWSASAECSTADGGSCSVGVGATF
ncbi:MAG: hypothetical protein JWM27_2599 [Gemmatimonadetes bacterium]|nr:hypothetical protein [Gemmatimonadota bacterium]